MIMDKRPCVSPTSFFSDAWSGVLQLKVLGFKDHGVVYNDLQWLELESVQFPASPSPEEGRFEDGRWWCVFSFVFVFSSFFNGGMVYSLVLSLQSVYYFNFAIGNKNAVFGVPFVVWKLAIWCQSREFF